MKTDRSLPRGRAPLFVGASALCAAALLSGCMSSPTYGTGKTANRQLLEDLTGVLSTDALTGANRQAEIAYKPRPELVRPASLEVLPEPQRDLASADNSAWPEAPEARRARLRAEATENRDDPNYRPSIISGVSSTPTTVRGHEFGNGVAHNDQVNTREQRAELLRRKREANQGSPTTRKYLSEPPLEYRVPNATAAADDLGEDEWKKQQRGKKAAGKGTTWRDFLPW